MEDQTSIFDFKREADWEQLAVQRAVRRYEAALLAAQKNGDPASMPPGRRVLYETVRPVAARIEEMRSQEYPTRPPDWLNVFQSFGADVLAVVAVCTALRAGILTASVVGTTCTVFNKRVGVVLRDQADHDRFVAEQEAAQRKAVAPLRKAAKVAAAQQDAELVRELSKVLSETHADQLLKDWRRRHPEANRRAWGRFAARITGARSTKWSEDLVSSIGGALGDALVTGAPEWFGKDQVGDGLPTHRPMCITLTPKAVEAMADASARAEIARPMLRPMIIPPLPWQYREKEAA
ncbi:hypothetical protein [Roseomonas sp. WA12]